MEGELPDRYKGVEGLVNLHRDLGVGIFLGAPSVVECYFSEEVEIVEKVETRRRRKDVEEQIVTRIFHTPLGDLKEMWRYRRDTHSSAPIEYAVKRPEDLKILRWIMERQEFEPHYDDFEYYDRLWGDQGIPVAVIPRTPLGDLVLRWIGVLNSAYIEMDAREEFKKTIEVMGEAQDELYRIVAESPAKIVEIGENLSAEVLGGRFFREYALDYYRKRVEQLHGAGKIVGVHLDGTVGGILPLLEETGIDFVESITPAPVGDLTMEEVMEQRGRLIIWGGMPGALFAPPFTKEDLEAHVKHVLSVAKERFILGTADQVPPNGDIDLVALTSEIVEEMSRGQP